MATTTGETAPTDLPAPARWWTLQIHLPCSRQSPYLRDVVAPLLQSTGMLDSFFFVRECRGGPHLRLKLLTGPDAGSPRAVTDVVDGLRAAMPELEASDLREYEQGAAVQERLAVLDSTPTEPVRPAGTVHVVRHVPEPGRFGGARGVAIAEEVFRRTSRAVLGMLPEHVEGRAVRPPLEQAVGAMAAALHAAGADVAGARTFTADYERRWRRYAPPTFRETWPRVHERYARTTARLCESLWEDGRTDHPIHAAIALAAAQARAASGQGDRMPLENVVLEGTPFTHSLVQYVSTTNNRLGLSPSAQGLVAHLVHRGLDGLAGAASPAAARATSGSLVGLTA